jgi:hypothetical protein
MIYVSTAMVDSNNLPNSHRDQRPDLTLDKRKLEYEFNFKKLKEFGLEFTIIETVVDKSEFLEQFGRVIYTNINNPNFINRGSNFINAFKKVIKEENLPDDELVIHMTGRYKLIDDSFFKECQTLSSTDMGCIKRDIHNQIYLFLYAIRSKLHLEVLESINLNEFDVSGICLERIFSLQLNNIKMKECNRLGIHGNQSNGNNTEYEKIIF